ncbi:MAG: 2-phosphosulfolactate phosphatase [Desulfobacterales bacterium]|nr:2-phosphosulfolactate phosphatase [Desulfobacterales bacterium]
MKFHVVHYARGAEKARGLAVVIDVFRAFSAACYAFDQGAKKIVAAESLDAARAVKQKHPDYLLMGERHAKKPPDFDLGNSPSEIAATDLTGKTLVHSTHAGTRALLAARGAQTVITASFVNAAAVARYIARTCPDDVYLVCAGFEGKSEALEDVLCAGYIRQLVCGDKPDVGPMAQQLKTAASALRFFDPKDPHSPEADFYMCMDANRFDCVITKTEADKATCVLKPVFGSSV